MARLLRLLVGLAVVLSAYPLYLLANRVARKLELDLPIPADQPITAGRSSLDPSFRFSGSQGRQAEVVMGRRQSHDAGSMRPRCAVQQGVFVYPSDCQDEVVVPPSALPQDVSIFTASKLPDDPRLMPEVGNGHTATVVRSDSVFMNGLYNGADVTSHRARVPSPLSVIINNVTSGHINFSREFALDVGRGVFYERWAGPGLGVELRTYAHRTLPELLVAELTLTRSRPLPLEVNLTVNTGSPSPDIDFHLHPVQWMQGVWISYGQTRQAEYPDVAPVTPVTVVWSEVQSSISLPPGLTRLRAVFLTAIHTDGPRAVAAFRQAADMSRNNSLFISHVTAWSDLWRRGRVDVEGNATLSRVNYGVLYFLLSSCPLVEDQSWPFVGLAPGGLAHGDADKDYMGHIFWDQDTWMFPGLAVLHGDIGRVVANTRLRTLSAARTRAANHSLPGAMFPWESGFTGLDVGPSEECNEQELHVSGDVVMAAMLYWRLTGDSSFLQAGGAALLADVAAFWAARVVLNPQASRYEIHEVMPPDEWHNPVNNSVYTNAVAGLSLASGLWAVEHDGGTPPSNWSRIIDHLYLPFNATARFHPEYDGYVEGIQVKQADVIMLGYPLGVTMPQDVRINDLNMYEKATPSGPDMTWSVFAINWLDVGQISKAAESFLKTTVNVKLPFYVWTEYADGTGAVNFHTGMGGFLQSLLYGYGGLRPLDDRLLLNPVLPPGVTQLRLVAFDYLGSSLDLVVTSAQMTLTLKHEVTPLTLVTDAGGSRRNLVENVNVTVSRQSAFITKTALAREPLVG